MIPVELRTDNGYAGDIQKNEKEKTENYGPDFSSESAPHINKSVTL
jgi:hypothetical protein